MEDVQTSAASSDVTLVDRDVINGVEEATPENVADWMTQASRRYAHFVGCTLAAAVSLMEHDPDEMDRFELAVGEPQKSRFKKLQAHLVEKKRVADEERYQRQKLSQSVPAMATMPTDGGNATDGEAGSQEAPESTPDQKPKAKATAKKASVKKN